jgi:hypothetical protein
MPGRCAHSLVDRASLGARREVVSVSRRPRAAVLANAVDVWRAPSEVFDDVRDLALEPEWNPKLRRIEKLADGPVTVGSRYRADFGLGGRMDIDHLELDRPTTWVTVGELDRLVARLEGRVLPAGDGARVTFRMELHAKSLFGPLLPLIRRTMRRAQQGRLAAIKRDSRR